MEPQTLADEKVEMWLFVAYYRQTDVGTVIGALVKSKDSKEWPDPVEGFEFMAGAVERVTGLTLKEVKETRDVVAYKVIAEEQLEFEDDDLGPLCCDCGNEATHGCPECGAPLCDEEGCDCPLCEREE